MVQNGSAGGSVAPEDQLKEIARGAAQRSASRLAEDARIRERVKLDHQKRFETAVAALKASVIPLLEQAKLAFQSEGVPVKIIENFEDSNAPQANVVFECCGPFWSDSHGAVDLAASDRAIFFHDGTDFHVGIAKSYSSDVGRRTSIEGEPARL